MTQPPEQPASGNPYDRADEDDDRPVDTIEHNGEYL